MRGGAERFPDEQNERAMHEHTLDALLSAHLIAPDAPVDSRLIDDALGRNHAREGFHRAPSSFALRLGTRAATGVVAAAVGLGGLTVAAYAGVLPDMVQHVAHDLINAPDVNRPSHHGPGGGATTAPPSGDASITPTLTSVPATSTTPLPSPSGSRSPQPTPTPSATPSDTPSTNPTTDVGTSSSAPPTAPSSTDTTTSAQHGKPSAHPTRPTGRPTPTR